MEQSQTKFHFLVVSTRVGGTIICVCVFPQGKFDEFKAADPKSGSQGFQEPLDALYMHVDEATKQELAQQFATGTSANGGFCTWVDSLGSVKFGVALVGDSGHAMWPSLGQGANCSLESTGVFCQVCRDILLSSTPSSAEPAELASAIVQEFNARRHANAMAAVDLTFGGIGGRLARGRQNASLSYKLQVLGIMLLNKTTLGLIPRPALLRTMDGDTSPYTTLWRYNFVYERVICVSALAAVCVPLVLGWAKRN